MILQRKRHQLVLCSLFVISNLVSHAMERSKKEENEDNKKKSCCICLTEDENLDFKWPTCSHQFHKECVGKWEEVSNKCPVCRTPNAEPPKEFGFDDEEVRSRNEEGVREFVRNINAEINAAINAEINADFRMRMSNAEFRNGFLNYILRDIEQERQRPNREHAAHREHAAQFLINQIQQAEAEDYRTEREQQQNLTADCEFCGTQIPMGTKMCKICYDVKKESESSSAANNADDVLGQDVVRNGAIEPIFDVNNFQRQPQQYQTADCEFCGTQIPMGTRMCKICYDVKKESENSSAANNADDVFGQTFVRNGLQKATETIDDITNLTSGAERTGYFNLLDDRAWFNPDKDRNAQMIHRPQRVFSPVEDNVLNPIEDTNRVKIDRLELVNSQMKKDNHKDYKF